MPPTDQPPAAFASLPRSVQEAMASALAAEIIETLDRLAAEDQTRIREGEIAYDVRLERQAQTNSGARLASAGAVVASR